MNATRKMTVAVLALGLAAFVGCANEPEPTTPAEATPDAGDPQAGKGEDSPGIAINPCELLDADEVGDALEQPVGEGERNKQTCTWISTEDEDVKFSLIAYDRGRTPRETCDDYFDKAGAEMVEGLGFKAAYSEEDGFSAFTRSGDFAVEGIPACLVLAPTPREQIEVDGLKALVEMIAGRPPFAD